MMGHVFIFGAIGTGRGEVSFQNVSGQLSLPENLASDEITVHIISPGGDVFEGEAIYNALKNAGKRIITHIEGTCASIATLIAGAGEKIIMNKTARFMIHNPKISAITQAADSRELRHVADQLDMIKTLLIDVYDRKTTLGKEKLWELYDNETWLTADEAEKQGFIDESTDAIKAVATINLNKYKMEAKDKGLLSFFKNLFALKKFKNEFTETLADGSVVIVMSEDGDWTGKQIVREDGSPIEAGNYTLVSGKVITVDANSTITQVADAPVEDKTETPEDMEKIKQLEAQLAAAKAAQAAAEAQIAARDNSAEAITARFEAKFKELDEKAKAQEEELKKVVGTVPPTNRGPVFKNADNPAKDYDPMGEEAKKYLTGRNRLN
jgi:ATP-dependent protease ClpP protease subunit